MWLVKSDTHTHTHTQLADQPAVTSASSVWTHSFFLAYTATLYQLHMLYYSVQ